MKEHADELARSWAEGVAPTVRGRLSHAELERQVADLQRGFGAALSAGATDLEGDAAAELRALLADLSATRARQGFSATETAISVFTLKDAVAAILGSNDGADKTTFRDFVAIS